MPKAPKSSRQQKIIHPSSRAAAQLSKRVHHDKKMDKHNSAKTMKINLLADKLVWFHEHLGATTTTYTKDDLHDMVSRYLGRFDEELEQIAIKQSLSKHRSQQHISRQQTINLTREREQQQYQIEGLEIPHLLNPKNVSKFSEWTREVRYIQTIPLMRLVAPKSSETPSKSVSATNEEPVGVPPEGSLPSLNPSTEQDISDSTISHGSESSHSDTT